VLKHTALDMMDLRAGTGTAVVFSYAPVGAKSRHGTSLLRIAGVYSTIAEDTAELQPRLKSLIGRQNPALDNLTL